ncbi:MAG: hypothetical protein GC205_03220 [Bacteroidetes bacterium]|nr:hypothetical protein [Bacteroidota bacterium]
MSRRTLSALALVASLAFLFSVAGCKNNPKFEGPQLMRWDFAEASTRSYQFEQRSASYSVMAMMMPDGTPMADTSQYKTVSTADLRVISAGGGSANMTLEGMLMRAYQYDPQTGVLLDSMTEEMDPITVENLKETGKPDSTDEQNQQLFDYLFPLPVDQLSVGETEERGLEVPFNTLGSVLPVGGTVKTTFTEITQHQNRTCARLDTELLLDQVDLPQDMPGEYLFKRSGTSTFYFDLEKREFVSGEVSITSTVIMDAGIENGIFNIESSDTFTLQLAE